MTIYGAFRPRLSGPGQLRGEKGDEALWATFEACGDWEPRGRIVPFSFALERGQEIGRILEERVWFFFPFDPEADRKFCADGGSGVFE